MLIFTESFEFSTGSGAGGGANGDKWNLSNTLSVWSGQGPRTGSFNADGSTSSEAKRQVAAADEHATFIIGVAAKNMGGAGTAKRFLTLYSDAGATTHVYVQTGATDATKLEVYRGGGTLLGSTASGVLTTVGTVYQYIEVKVTLNDTTGAVVIRVDETPVLSLTGVDTKNGGTKTVFDSFGIQGMTGSTWFDDIYACNGAGSTNNDFLGAVRIEALHPNANGNSSGMTNSAGNSTNNYTYVDDAFPIADTTDYVDGVTTGDKDTYTFADSAQPAGNSVKAVVVYASAQKTDAGARGLSLVARSGGTEATAAAATALVNGVYHLVWGVFETKPGGGSWTVSDYNAAEFGLQAT
jgi:hypothetical protein